jgi:hypothetical protein
VVRNAKTSKKSNMQPGDAADYDVEARAYFESLRQPFEQTLKSTRKPYVKWVERVIGLTACVGLAALPFVSSRVVTFVFHQQIFTFSGQPHEITQAANAVLFLSLMGATAVMILHSFVEHLEQKNAISPLSQRVMVFALSYAILRELESFERSNLPHHRQIATELWTRLLTYLRWTLENRCPGMTHFRQLPSSDYAVAPYAQRFAEALNWKEVNNVEYGVVSALNNLHSKISPRLQNDQDLPLLKEILRGIGNFFYTTVVQRREGQASWGYSELLRSAEIINGLAPITRQEGSHRSFLSARMFTHTNIAVAFMAWWMVFQTLFVVLIILSFRFFPTLTMNSQAMVGLIAAPIAAAISMVGISRKSS